MSSLPPVTTAGMAVRRPRERREWAAKVRSWGPKREFWREVGREARVEWRMSRVKERKRKEMGKWTVAGWIGLPMVFLFFGGMRVVVSGFLFRWCGGEYPLW